MLLQVMSCFFSNLLNFFIYVGPTKENLNKHPPVLVNILQKIIIIYLLNKLWKMLSSITKRLVPLSKIVQATWLEFHPKY